LVQLTFDTQLVVGIWIPLWGLLTKSKSDNNNTSSFKTAMFPAALLGSAMVARGEIGLLIVEIGYNETPYVSETGLQVAVWAILLNTIIGPVVVGLIIKYKGGEIGRGQWGLQKSSQNELTDTESQSK